MKRGHLTAEEIALYRGINIDGDESCDRDNARIIARVNQHTGECEACNKAVWDTIIKHRKSLREKYGRTITITPKEFSCMCSNEYKNSCSECFPSGCKSCQFLDS